VRKLLLLLLFIPLVYSCSKGETITYNLTTSLNPNNAGTVSPVSGKYNEGDELTLIANPKMEFNFDKWTGSVSGTSNPLKIVMDNDKTVVANFTPKTPSRVRYELSEVWKGKIEVPKGEYPVGYTTYYCGRYYYQAYRDKLWMLQSHHYSVDSLIVDFSKVHYDGTWGGTKFKDLLLIRPRNTSAKRYIPSKIGYIKFIGDTINKRLFWEFESYMYEGTKHLPIKYGDSNIDFTDLIYEGASICTTPRKIKNNSNFVFFKKEDVTKTTFINEVNYDPGSMQKYKVGDTISFYSLAYKIHSIKFLYD